MSNRSGRQWSGKSRGGRFGYLFFVCVIRFFGIGFAYAFLSLIVVYFIPFAPVATASVWKYCRRRRKLGRVRSCIEIYRHYYAFGQTLIDKVALKGGMADRYRFEFDNYDRFLEIIDSGEGVVMIGAHVGCWEAGSVFFGKYGKKINIVMFDAEHRQIKEVLEDNAEGGDDFKIIAVNEDPLGAMLKIKNALDGGEYVCFNGDRWVDRNSAVEARLAGAAALFPSGPFKIASRCRVPVVFYYAVREKGRTYRFIFDEAAAGGRCRQEELLARYTESLERIMERYPRQWFNFFDFWKD